jgi:8-oxo-dGTP pyrophosphatase MutT (NUDIX family)
LTENRLHPKDLDRLRRRLEESPDENSNAAVAILMRPVDDDLEVFLVKRAEVDGDPWSGDMAFPGGKRGSQDKSLLDTAVREVMEETSIDLRGHEPLGYLEPLFSWVRNTFSVQPILYLYEGDSIITLNYELTKYAWTPVKELEKTRSQAVVKGWDSPVFKVGEDVVWGLTYRMLEELLEALGND